MTEEEEKIVRTYLSWVRHDISKLSELADSFHKVGMTETAEKLRIIEQSIKHNAFEYLAKKLIKD